MADWSIYEFLDRRGNGILRIWAVSEHLTDADLAKLDQKVLMLSHVGLDLALNTKFVAGPIHDHIYKLVVKGRVMLRPMLCRGPIYNNVEVTFVLGAIERGGRLVPRDWQSRATENRQIVIHDPKRRRIYELFKT